MTWKQAARLRVVDQIGGTCRTLVRRGHLLIDCAAPSGPVEVGRFLTGAGIAAIACGGDHVYATAGENGVYVIDVSDSAHPTCSAHLTGFQWAGSVVHEGRTLYVADLEAFDEPSREATRNGARDDALSLIDVADVRRPRFRSFPFAFRYAAAVATDGNRLIVLDGESARAGLRTLHPGAADRLTSQTWMPAEGRLMASA